MRLFNYSIPVIHDIGQVMRCGLGTDITRDTLQLFRIVYQYIIETQMSTRKIENDNCDDTFVICHFNSTLLRLIRHARITSNG